MAGQEKQSGGDRSDNSIPPPAVFVKVEALPNSAPTPVLTSVAKSSAAAAHTRPETYPPPRSRPIPPARSQPARKASTMATGDGVVSGKVGGGRQLWLRVCGAIASVAVVAAGILLCLAPLYLHGGSSAVQMLLGCLGLLLVILGLVGLFISFLSLGGGSGSRPPAVMPSSGVKQPLLGGRRGSWRPTSNMTVVVE